MGHETQRTSRMLPVWVDEYAFICIYYFMRTTIDLPNDLLERTKIEAVKRRTTIKQLVMEGLQAVLAQPGTPQPPSQALERLKSGYRLGGTPLSRGEVHER